MIWSQYIIALYDTLSIKVMIVGIQIWLTVVLCLLWCLTLNFHVSLYDIIVIKEICISHKLIIWPTNNPIQSSKYTTYSSSNAYHPEMLFDFTSISWSYLAFFRVAPNFTAFLTFEICNLFLDSFGILLRLIVPMLSSWGWNLGLHFADPFLSWLFFLLTLLILVEV